jgi:Flp pilus assembly secretin CpaC
MMALHVGSRGPALGRARSSSTLALLFVLGVAAIAAPANAADISVILDHDRLVKLPEKVATVVVGNPLIANVTLQSGGLMILTGKSYGTTNVIALDRSGAVLVERTVEVSAPTDTVVVYRGVTRETYSCNPFCNPRIMPGDAPAFFREAIGQAITRNEYAQSMAGSK